MLEIKNLHVSIGARKILGVCVTSCARDWFEWEHSRPQQLDACSAVHGTLKCLQAIGHRQVNVG
jgi:hypothetical protein